MFFDEFFKEGYIIGRCVTHLKLMVELAEREDIERELLYKEYPLITEDIIKEIKELDLDDSKDSLSEFYKNNLELFKDTNILVKAEKDANRALKMRHIEEELNYFFKNLKTEKLKDDKNGFNVIIVSTNYSKGKKSLIESNLTKYRIELANKFVEMEESSIDEIKEIVKKQELNDSDDYSVFKLKNCILEIRSILNNDYNLYRIYHISNDEYWKITKVNYGEKLDYFKVDEYNRLIV